MSIVRLSVDGKIASICLDNQKKLNALTPLMLSQIEEHCAAIEANADIRAVLLRAEGERAFCVGADIDAWSSMTPFQFARRWVREGHRIIDRFANLPIPTIGVISGYAFGGGLELAAACDLRVFANDTICSMPETGIGIVPGWSGTQRLSKQIPQALIKEMVFTGCRIGAKRMYECGFANLIAEDPLENAQKIADKIAQRSPKAVEASKYMISIAQNEDVGALVEALAGGLVKGDPDLQEGLAAFYEKREPLY